MVAVAAYCCHEVEYFALERSTVHLAGHGAVDFTPMCDGKLWPATVVLVARSGADMSVYRSNHATGLLSQLSGSRDLFASADCLVHDMCASYCREVVDIEESYAVLVQRLGRICGGHELATRWRSAAMESLLCGRSRTAKDAKAESAWVLSGAPEAVRKIALARRRPRIFLSPGMDLRR